MTNLGPGYPALSVKDVSTSRIFYESLGFEVFDGAEQEGWLMARNGENKIGLFQGMFEANRLAFHPPDVRTIQAQLKADGIVVDQEADASEGPATVLLKDPDGNEIMLDQP